MSSVNFGTILKLFISESGNQQRVPKESLELNTLGVQGDKFYNKDVSRSILITSTHSYNLIKEYEIDMPFGYLGENILIDTNPYDLEMGTRLKIGSAILELSNSCTICNHLSVIDKRIPALLKNDRGVFAKVVQDGCISKGDAVSIL